MLPESVEVYGQKLVLGPDTPALVGRFASLETVAVSVYTPGPAPADNKVQIIWFDLRRNTYPLRKDDLPAYPPGVVVEKIPIKIGDNPGFALRVDGHLQKIFWENGRHSYSLMVGSAALAKLIQVATQIS